MGRQFDTLLSLIGTDMGGNDPVFEINRQGMGIGLHCDLSADGPRRDGVIVGIKADGEVGIDFQRVRVPAIG